jgi:hypothetical protein
MERMNIPPATEGSWDRLIHKRTNGSNSILILRGDNNQRNQAEELLAPDSLTLDRVRNINGTWKYIFCL